MFISENERFSNDETVLIQIHVVRNVSILVKLAGTGFEILRRHVRQNLTIVGIIAVDAFYFAAVVTAHG